MRPARGIDEYIGGFPSPVRERLNALRRVIAEEAPMAEEAMRYGMPTFRTKVNLVHFAAFKDHIGFYPTPSAIVAFERELEEYSTGKGTVRFPMDRPLPLDLVRRMVRFRVSETEG